MVALVSFDPRGAFIVVEGGWRKASAEGAHEDATSGTVGNGSIYNHYHLQNLRYPKRICDGLSLFRALRCTLEGEEFVRNDNGAPTDRSPLWLPSSIEVDDGER